MTNQAETPDDIAECQKLAESLGDAIEAFPPCLQALFGKVTNVYKRLTAERDEARKEAADMRTLLAIERGRRVAAEDKLHLLLTPGSTIAEQT